MCSLMYGSRERLSSSPYSLFLEESLWEEISMNFASTHAKLSAISQESLLFVCTTVGSLALPTLIKLATVMKMKSDKDEWNTQKQLPVEIPVPKEHQYHSIFTCPVSREQSTKENPPVLLPCGHVICKNSMMRLIKLSRFKLKFKHSNHKSKIKNWPKPIGSIGICTKEFFSFFFLSPF
eukprot:TRINITY_DN3234_c0_g1_i1.p2 TRINITY_DN3234_c0_g1~~TRINITY_DN3234_c0_g1_i1.p2  ORF type:complete len:179 (+),score=47.81 TRINITY_DN3234_c0_g1_i1:260-796(+)